MGAWRPKTDNTPLTHQDMNLHSRFLYFSRIGEIELQSEQLHVFRAQSVCGRGRERTGNHCWRLEVGRWEPDCLRLPWLYPIDSGQSLWKLYAMNRILQDCWGYSMSKSFIISEGKILGNIQLKEVLIIFYTTSFWGGKAPRLYYSMLDEWVYLKQI